MQQSQPELWSAEPHPTVPVYPQLTPQQRSKLVEHLAQLILKMVQDPPPASTQPKDHER